MEKHKPGTLLALQNAVCALLREHPSPHSVRLALTELDEATKKRMARHESTTPHSTDPQLEGYAASMAMFWNELGGPE